jgi:hypothetical protein
MYPYLCAPGPGMVTQQPMPRSGHRHPSSAVALSRQQRGELQKTERTKEKPSSTCTDCWCCVALQQSHSVLFCCRVARVLRHEVVLGLHRARVHLNSRHRHARHPWTVYALLRVDVPRLSALPQAPRQKWLWTRLRMCALCSDSRSDSSTESSV